ncbi:MAG: MltA domain-containing protein [Hyphomicrobiales bacterium]|nr:MltA domain-containing protein [Hyphomicrobiales bacterium]
MSGPASLRLQPLDYEDLQGFGADDHLAAFRCFERSARALVRLEGGTRTARPPSPALVAAAGSALASGATDGIDARRFFEALFRPFRIVPDPPDAGFLTGYYEPCVQGSPVETDAFCWPILARPPDLVGLAPGETPPGFPEGVSGARRRGDGSLVPYDDRRTIEREQRSPIVWLRDAVEAFLIQVQGSAQIEFADGRRARLAYDGRNGLPYTSIGRILTETGEIAESAMSLESLKAWLRAAGLSEGERGLELMRRNRSFVFFRLIEDFDPRLGPVAGAGVALTPLRSIAVDKTIWSYGLPFWIEADLPWADEALRPFRRLMIAQDTGSAIVGPARADIFFGSGDAAGARAGAIRHQGAFAVLLPVGDEP